MKVSLPFRDAEGKSRFLGRLLWNSGEQGALVLLLALPIESRAHNCHYEPCSKWAKIAMLHRFIFAVFSETLIQAEGGSLCKRQSSG